MAIEIVHSRTATLIDGSNPDEIQAADWNDTHPITGDGMGLLFSNSAGAVAETMTVDMGTLTASTPLTFKQTWEDATNTVAFRGFAVDIKTRDGLGLLQGDTNNSPLFSVRYIDGLDVARDVFDVTENRVRSTKIISLYDDNYTGTPVISVSALDGGNVLAGSEAASYCRIDPNSVRARSEDTGDTWQADLYGNRLEYTTNTGQAFQLPLFTTDAGTLTASSPYTFKQTWDNAAADVVFRGVVIEAVDVATGEQGDPASSYFDIKTGAAGSTTRKLSYGRSGLNVNGSLQLFDADLDTGNVVIDVNVSSKSMVLGIVGVDNAYTTYAPGGARPVDVSASQDILYGPYGPVINSGKFFLPVTQTEIAAWAGAPSTSDIDAGYAQVGKDTSTGNVWLAVNDGGTIKKVQLT